MRTKDQKRADYARMYGAGEVQVGRVLGVYPPPVEGWSAIPVEVIAERSKARVQ